MRGGRVTASLAVLALTIVGGCSLFEKKPKHVEDDNSKAFAELEKNDRDDTTGKAPSKDGGAEEKPKGPVYPAPFTAEQIHEATKNGRTYRYKIEVPNKPTKEHVITFRNVDDNGAEVHSGGDQVKRFGWLTLQQHAEFPKDKVTTHEEKLKTPAGKFRCIVYEVKGEENEVWTYYFAKELPGAPVFFYVERNGKRLRTTTLVEHLAGK